MENAVNLDLVSNSVSFAGVSRPTGHSFAGGIVLPMTSGRKSCEQAFTEGTPARPAGLPGPEMTQIQARPTNFAGAY